MLLSACAINRPTDEQIATADYGRAPKNPQRTVMEYMKMRLPDSESALYTNWSGWIKGWTSTQSHYGEVLYGYIGCVYINSKDFFGAYDYNGTSPYVYVIRNDEIVDMKGGWPWGSVEEKNIQESCASIFEKVKNKRPTTEQIAVADYGSVPKNPQQTVMEHMKTVLVNPEGARYDKWSNLRKQYWFNEDDDNTYLYGYMGCVYINVNNELGGYNGFRPAVYLIKNDKVILMTMDLAQGTKAESEGIKASCAPLYQINTNAEPITSRQQVYPQGQRVSLEPLPIKIGE